MKRRSWKKYGVLVFVLAFAASILSVVNWIGNTKDIEVQTVEAQKEAKPVKQPQKVVDTGPVYPFMKVDFTKLRKQNPDISGWLRVGSINLDIPIVQTTDNEFYLSHDLDKKPNRLGWVFADSRSGLESLGTNTVLYGHNAANRSMFGSLKGLLDTTEQTKEENKIIQFTTPTTQYVFEIFSVYVTDYEDWHYVKQIFTDESQRTDFISRGLAKNTIPAFARTDVSTMDKFLTFSTCYGPAGTTKRLVVQAKLVAENQVYTEVAAK